MEQNLTAQSFIVRVYRADTQDTRKITGLVETLDGTGGQAPFRDVGELAAIFNRGAEGKKKRRRKCAE